MDDQRCPLEDGQPAAAEATATPTLEGRVGESAPTPLQAPRAGQASCKVPRHWEPLAAILGDLSSARPPGHAGCAASGRGRPGSLWPPPTREPPAGLTESSRGLGLAEAVSGSLGGVPASPA